MVTLTLNNDLSCGGNNISVQVCAQGQCCKIPIGNVNRGETYTKTNLPNECKKVRASELHRPRVCKILNK